MSQKLLPPVASFDRKSIVPVRIHVPWWKRLLRIFVVGLIIFSAPGLWMLIETRTLRFTQIENVPPCDLAIVLGTSPRREDGSANLHFEHRMDAAAALWKRGLAKQLLASGDGRGPYYDETRDMKAALQRRGVPASAILIDPQGLRTLASIRRANQFFGVRHCLIVSDGWHLPRALFLARRSGVHAEGVACKPVPWTLSFKSRSREWLARFKAVLDMYGD